MEAGRKVSQSYCPLEKELIINEASPLFGIMGLYATVVLAMYLYLPPLFYVLVAFLALVVLGKVAGILAKVIDAKTKGSIK